MRPRVGVEVKCGISVNPSAASCLGTQWVGFKLLHSVFVSAFVAGAVPEGPPVFTEQGGHRQSHFQPFEVQKTETKRALGHSRV